MINRIKSMMLFTVFTSKLVALDQPSEKEVVLSNSALALVEYARAISFSSGDKISKDIIIELESSGRWYVVNSDGCGGRFQFCPETRKALVKTLGITPSKWMEKRNQLKMFNYLYAKNKSLIAADDFPTNTWFLYGGWQQGSKGIVIIAKTLLQRERLRPDVHAGIVNNISSVDKDEWESRTKEILYTIWRDGQYRQDTAKLFTLSEDSKMSCRQKTYIKETLTKEGYELYKVESDSVLATIWANKFSNKIDDFDSRY